MSLGVPFDRWSVIKSDSCVITSGGSTSSKDDFFCMRVLCECVCEKNRVYFFMIQREDANNRGMKKIIT